MQSYFNTQKPVTGIYCINGLKNDAIILIDEEKAFDKYPTCNPNKNTQQTWNRRNILNPMKGNSRSGTEHLP